MAPPSRLRILHPTRLVALSFVTAIAVGSLLLMLPVASETDTRFIDAVFTATSAVCVTGLVVVDTGGHWSTFGELVVLGMIQLGGLGFMTLASVVGLAVSRRVGIRRGLLASAELGAVQQGDTGRVLAAVAAVTVVVETVVAAFLFLRFHATGDFSVLRSAYLGVFHSVSAFNNSGFSLFSDSMMGFAGDIPIVVLIGGAVIIGGIGFPVIADVARHRHRIRRLSLHSKLTLIATGALLLFGFVAILGLEWTNPDTLGDMSVIDKSVTATFESIMPRTAGFNSIDYGAVDDSTSLVVDGLMMVGGGSASTAGGIKVGTLAVLLLITFGEFRGTPDVQTLGRRIPGHVQRQALAVATLGLVVVATATALLSIHTPFTLRAALFEVISAAGTVGLSTGITASLNDFARVVLIVVMFLGRVGPLTLAAALALRQETRKYRYPEEAPLIG